MHRRLDLIVCTITITALMFCAPAEARSQDEAPFLTYTADSFKTTLVCSNLTASILNNWPNVAFYHTKDRISPVFYIGTPIVYLFNDTNGDGLFVRSEIEYLAYLDDLHDVTWNISDVQLGVDPSAGQYVVLSRWADLALYDSREAVTPVVDNWARMHFSFRITENPVTFHNDLGDYVVQGKIDIQVNMSLEITHRVNSSGVVIEHSLKAGLNTYTFLLTEDVGLDSPVQTQVLSRVDETVNGEDFAHRFNLTDLPTQRIEIAKDDGTVQVHHKMSSVPLMRCGADVTKPQMSCSYYTTGSDMILHTAFMVRDANGTITHEVTFGIDEAGFYEGVGDWFRENLPVIMIVTGTIVAAISVVLFVMIYRKSVRKITDAEKSPVQKQDEKPPDN
ncbi:MAG: hypothetical protein JW880_01085 [Candidatus Thermoplasmatota archaeon]|nr:hypothetical protein [Candidatus Thermoplasmatota archaeon]